MSSLREKLFIAILKLVRDLVSADRPPTPPPILCQDTFASLAAVVVGATGLKLQPESAVKMCLPNPAQINVLNNN